MVLRCQNFSNQLPLDVQTHQRTQQVPMGQRILLPIGKGHCKDGELFFPHRAVHSFGQRKVIGKQAQHTPKRCCRRQSFHIRCKSFPEAILVLRKMQRLQFPLRQNPLPSIQKTAEARQVVPLHLPCQIRCFCTQQSIRFLPLRLHILSH